MKGCKGRVGSRCSEGEGFMGLGCRRKGLGRVGGECAGSLEAGRLEGERIIAMRGKIEMRRMSWSASGKIRMPFLLGYY